MGRRPIKGGSGKLTQGRVVVLHKESHGSCLGAQCSHDDVAQRERDACMYVHQRFAGILRLSPPIRALPSILRDILKPGILKRKHRGNEYLHNASITPTPGVAAHRVPTGEAAPPDQTIGFA